jgi:2-methylisocitrate lyase-like PEP mutase family enzyme
MAMHQGQDILVLPNAYDAISAALMADAGARAIATTSGGCAFALGYPDGEKIPRALMLEAIGRMADAIELPLSADMEAGFGESAEAVAETLLLTAEAGAVGINIEDSTKGGKRTLIDFDLAVKRISAARVAADSTGMQFVVNARTDAFAVTNDKAGAFDEAVKRANAYFEAGADCAFVIGVRDGDTIGRLAQEIRGPLNILAGPGSPSVAELAALGVKRVTVGSSFAKAAMTLVQKGAQELLREGTYGFAEGALGQPDINRALEGKRAD